MESDSASRGQRMKDYNARLARIVAGLAESEVRAILGEPSALTSRDAKTTPTDFFREIGSIFRFPDDDTDIIWLYVDPYRPRMHHYVGFKCGEVRTTWRETLTPERWQELQRSGEA